MSSSGTQHRPKQCVDLRPVVLSQRRQDLIRWKLRKRSTQTFKRNGKNSVVFKSTTLVRVSERKTKQEKMYARHGKMLAFFPPICYDEITLNSKEKKTCKGTSLQGHREFRGIFRTVENGGKGNG